MTGTYGTLGWSATPADGSYTYSLDNTNTDVQALAGGETLLDTFVYTLDDGSGTANATDTATLTITIDGTNDQPVATDNDNAVTEGRRHPDYHRRPDRQF